MVRTKFPFTSIHLNTFYTIQEKIPTFLGAIIFCLPPFALNSKPKNTIDFAIMDRFLKIPQHPHQDHFVLFLQQILHHLNRWKTQFHNFMIANKWSFQLNLQLKCNLFAIFWHFLNCNNIKV